ncbi:MULTISPECIES: acyltransferase [unclassified Pseudocitrobacter]|uniref:acyltransferase n=1 Tax=unclassified Pseudocitrobacter TaxID=2638778 RepID=UPI0023E3616D|nr:MULTISPECIES: acyltransferase [unclassified Pseudocitrobacter]MDF3829203.1 acyltransferase [Pseudocitrobacter sp. 2023EL-00150]MEC5373170.1 acyltransferase [Pseudocitrobacter sp. MW920760]
MTFQEFVNLVESRNGHVIGEPVIWKAVNVSLNGERTVFEFDSNVKVDGVSITDYGGDNRISIGKGSKLNGMIKIGAKCTLVIGERFSSTAGLKLHLAEGKGIFIGNDCMFGIDVNIYNHDYHPIFFKSNGERINYSRDVVIQDCVWLANKVTVLKGVTIHKGAIIGLGSTVVNKIDSYCLAVGSPAKVVKEGIVWHKASLNTTHPYGINNISELLK